MPGHNLGSFRPQKHPKCLKMTQNTPKIPLKCPYTRSPNSFLYFFWSQTMPKYPTQMIEKIKIFRFEEIFYEFFLYFSPTKFIFYSEVHGGTRRYEWPVSPECAGTRTSYLVRVPAHNPPTVNTGAGGCGRRRRP